MKFAETVIVILKIIRAIIVLPFLLAVIAIYAAIHTFKLLVKTARRK